MSAVITDGMTFGDWMHTTQAGVESALDRFLPAPDAVAFIPMEQREQAEQLLRGERHELAGGGFFLNAAQHSNEAGAFDGNFMAEIRARCQSCVAVGACARLGNCHAVILALPLKNRRFPARTAARECQGVRGVQTSRWAIHRQ